MIFPINWQWYLLKLMTAGGTYTVNYFYIHRIFQSINFNISTPWLPARNGYEKSDQLWFLPCLIRHGRGTVKILWASAREYSQSQIILCMRPANERWRYNVTSSLIDWVHTQMIPDSAMRLGDYMTSHHPFWTVSSIKVLKSSSRQWNYKESCIAS